MTVFCLCVSVGADIPQNVASSAAVFLGIVPGPRQAAMGESTVGLEGAMDSFILNPAGLADMKGFQMVFSHTAILFDVTMEYLAFWYEIPKIGTFGYFGRYLKSPSFELTDAYGVILGPVVSSYGFDIGLAYGRNIGKKFSAGAAVSVYHDSLYTVSATGVTFDAGAQYRLFRSIRLGLMLGNFGPAVKYSSAAYPLPFNVRAGAAWSWSPSDARFFRILNVTAALLAPNDNHWDFQSGAELVLNIPGSKGSSASLRAGLRSVQNKEILADLSFGLGIVLKTFKCEYSISPAPSELGFIHRISVVFLNDNTSATRQEKSDK